MEEKIERILKTLLKLQGSMNTKGNNEDIERAIA
jgi:hypothetical protein